MFAASRPRPAGYAGHGWAVQRRPPPLAGTGSGGVCLCPVFGACGCAQAAHCVRATPTGLALRRW